MPLARKHQIIPGQPGFYHCVSRCVRRAWLCGLDPLSGKCYDHRRDWLIERMRVLTTCFGIDVYAYAVMSNHCHIVLYVDPGRIEELTDEEIVRRWRTVWNWRDPLREITLPTNVSTKELATWRSRLGDISWFMRMLNEPIARIANSEDNCKGHFWESRFKSTPLLDEGAVLACMTYVDLNPIKGGVAEDIESSDFVSIQERLRTETTIPEREPLSAVMKHGISAEGVKLSIVNTAYIALVRETADRLKSERQSIDPTFLKGIAVTSEGWISAAKDFLRLFRTAAGSEKAFVAFMDRTGRKRRSDEAGRKLLYLQSE